MPTNDILPFCGTDTGSNLLSQSAYAADSQRTIGNQSGVARSGLVNKVLRQTSFVAAAVAKAINNLTGTDVLDDGNVDALAAKFETAIKNTGVPLGCPQIFFGSTAPSGYVLCYGQTLSRTTYAALFAVIGTTYGAGDGSTTFAIPDMRGYVPAGKDNMGGTAANRITTGVCGINGSTLGATGGDQRMQQHDHSVTDNGHHHDVGYGSVTPSGVDGGGFPNEPLNPLSLPGTVSHSTTTSVNTTGIVVENAGAGSSQNVQPTIIVNYILRTGV